VERLLIVNADDFGLTEGVNRGIVDAHAGGIVTSASLMVRARGAEHAAELARQNPRLGLGLHFDIGEWVRRDGTWRARYEYVTEGDATSTEAELGAQIARFEELIGKPPDHLDSHQHVHLSRPEVAAAVRRASEALGIGVRGLDPRVSYRGMYGQDEAGRSVSDAIGPSAYVDAIRSLPAGVTEFGCHPGYTEDLDSDYRLEREIEVRTLCDAAVRAITVESGVRLISWADLVQ